MKKPGQNPQHRTRRFLRVREGANERQDLVVTDSAFVGTQTAIDDRKERKGGQKKGKKSIL